MECLDEIFSNTFKINNSNNKYISFIKQKYPLEKSMINVIERVPDGNCLFRSNSQFLFQTEEKYNLIRMAIYTYF